MTTQLGHRRDTRLTEEEIRGEQMFLVMSRSGGVGPSLPTPQVRTALAVRLNGIARGWSGASPAVADVLVASSTPVCTQLSPRSDRSVPVIGPWGVSRVRRGRRDATIAELNAADDNPLASAVDQSMISNGNSHPMVLAIACDALRIALIQVGQLCERRMSHFWDSFMQQLTSGSSKTPLKISSALYGLQLRYLAAAVFAELKQLAAPATLGIPPLDLGVEGHHTAAPLTVRKTDVALGMLEDLLVIELMLAHGLLSV